MAKKNAEGLQLDAIARGSDVPEISFDLDNQDLFVKSLGVTFVHYRAMPSPIGMKDRGEYRRSDSLDSISSNGFIYHACGEFTAALLGNSKKHTSIDAGLMDQSTARLTLPRFYDETSPTHAKEPIYLAPGDRVYIKDLEVAVATYQKVNHNPMGHDLLQYPALCVEFLMDSRGIEYKQGVDFKINKHGNIEWIDGRKNPGTDEDTGLGRVYSIRYRYNAHWYVAQLLNEVRVTNVTTDGVRAPARMPYHAMIQREYVYHTKVNNGSNEKQSDNGEPSRVVAKPRENINPNKHKIKVNVNTFVDEEDGE